MPTRNKPQKINAVTTTQYETSGKHNADLLSHNLPGGKMSCECRVLPTDPICQVVTGTAVIFHLAGRQDRQYVSLLNIIYNALS